MPLLRPPVPEAHDSGFAFPAQDADGGGVEAEEAPVLRCEIEPAGGQDAEDVAVGEEGGFAFGLQRPTDDAPGSFRHLFHGLAVDNAVAPEVPTGAVLLDLGGGATFIVAVVPFAEIRIRLGHVEISSIPAGFAGSPEGAGQYQGEPAPVEITPNGLGAGNAVSRKWDIGATGVGAGKAPFGFAVPDEPKLLL